jgi:poly-gamma-glutamate capsule biosynthesis protein CapA/YwtB (metallophosphatase superfamily)
MIHIHISKLQWLCSSFLLAFTAFSQGEQKNVSLLFIGDVMQHSPQIKGAYNAKTDSYEYEHSWQFIKPVISEADIAIANLEVTHAGKPYSGYPQFSAPDDLSRALKNVGFDIILTANNHSCDGGSKGVVRTLDVLDSFKLPHTGTFRNKAERDKNYPLIVEKNGIKIAVLNYTYGTNGLYVKAPLIINYIDSAIMKKDFEKAKQQADYIICTMHWGEEYKPLPNAKQKSWEKYCYELGADMVIGSHPHVIQPVERKTINGKDKLTAYSLGNFVSNQRDRYKNGGMILRSIIGHDGEQVVLKDADYILAYVHTVEEGAFKHYYVLPDYKYDSLDAQFFNATEQVSRDLFFSDSRQLMEKNGKNISEYKIAENTIIDRILTGYYAIMVDSTELKVLEKDLPHTEIIYMVNDFNGKTFTLIGYSESEIAARGNKQIIDMIVNKPEDVKIVYVNRLGIKEVE